MWNSKALLERASLSFPHLLQLLFLSCGIISEHNSTRAHLWVRTQAFILLYSAVVWNVISGAETLTKADGLHKLQVTLCSFFPFFFFFPIGLLYLWICNASNFAPGKMAVDIIPQNPYPPPPPDTQTLLPVTLVFLPADMLAHAFFSLARLERYSFLTELSFLYHIGQSTVQQTGCAVAAWLFDKLLSPTGSVSLLGADEIICRAGIEKDLQTREREGRGWAELRVDWHVWHDLVKNRQPVGSCRRAQGAQLCVRMTEREGGVYSREDIYLYYWIHFVAQSRN